MSWNESNMASTYYHHHHNTSFASSGIPDSNETRIQSHPSYRTAPNAPLPLPSRRRRNAYVSEVIDEDEEDEGDYPADDEDSETEDQGEDEFEVLEEGKEPKRRYNTRASLRVAQSKTEEDGAGGSGLVESGSDDDKSDSDTFRDRFSDGDTSEDMYEPGASDEEDDSEEYEEGEEE